MTAPKSDRGPARKPRRGTCSTCRRRFVLRRDGSVGSHEPKGGAQDRWDECPGSGEKATEYASEPAPEAGDSETVCGAEQPGDGPTCLCTAAINHGVADHATYDASGKLLARWPVFAGRRRGSR